ncbi:MAG: hypothetical protein E6772_10425 [Dysgonomonas sp.]|nr:hypothetical protein [Dysgonomonas sp.]
MKELTEEQKAQVNDLVNRLDRAGAKNPLQWARSEVYIPDTEDCLYLYF